MKNSTLFHALQNAADLGLSTSGIRYLDRRETETVRRFPDLAERAAKIAQGLWNRGVRPGDTVAIVLPTSPHFTDIFFACSWMNAIPVPLYPPVRLGRLEEYYDQTALMLKKVEASVLVTDDRAGKLMGAVLQRYTPRNGIHRVEKLLADTPMDAHTPTPDDIALVQFSSGTTGQPKPVALTHQQVIANAEVILSCLPQENIHERCGVSWLPLYHDMGLIGCVFPALLSPASIVLIPPEAFLARPSIWLRALSKYKGMIAPAPNFAYDLCVERIKDEELDGCDLSSWQFALNGAETTSPKTMRSFYNRFKKWGLRQEAMTPVYGLSEAALAVTFGSLPNVFTTTKFSRDDLRSDQVKPCPDGIELASVGKPLHGFGVQIRTDEGQLSAPDKIGRIWVKGPSVMDQYLDGTPPPRDGEWLDTGDLGFIFDDQLYISGRAKEIIVIRGRNHTPGEFEQPLDSVEGIRTGCSIAVGEPTVDGERLIVFTEYRGQPSEDLAERCQQAIRAATGISPDLLITLEPGTLPRTSSGKMRRGLALRQWNKGELDAPNSVTPWFLAGALARSAWTEVQHRLSNHD
ncbi:MAG: AMP-dependent synthetase [Deltaproteobacteria bacterium]|nr:AMP-dependent synthetase [Deltaproteobacteria bacterium]